MSRPKGTKNRKKYVSIEEINKLMAEKNAQREELINEIKVEAENISSIRSVVRKKKNTLRSLERIVKALEDNEAEMEKKNNPPSLMPPVESE